VLASLYDYMPHCILGTYFIVLGMYYCMFIVLGTYYCMFAVYVLLYCVYFSLYYVRNILCLRFIVLCLRFIVLCCTTV
jgi:hypothetical protein